MTTNVNLNEKKTRNICIIAHVDHGKTTLVDAIIKTDESSVTNQSMDKNALERERGITILAKATRVNYKEHIFHIVDTPGHADFGAEVERILCMVDGAVILVDAAEGVMPQSKFVLSKAVANKKKILVIVNKIDKPESRIEEVVGEIFDLLINLKYDDMPKILYGSGREGFFSSDVNIAQNIEKYPEKKNLNELMDTIMDYFPSPYVEEGEFKYLVSLLDSDPHLGKIYIGKIYAGSIKEGDSINAIDMEGKKLDTFRVLKLFKFSGANKIPITEASKGDIIGIAGGSEIITVNHTLCHASNMFPVPSIPIDQPTMAVEIGCNTSPFAGKDAKDKSKLTFNSIKRRFKEQAMTDVGIRVEFNEKSENILVYVRGELQLGIILENMRREGYELTVKKPQILMSEDNKEPIEEVVIDVDDQNLVSEIINEMNMRKSPMTDIIEQGTRQRLKFIAPTRFLMGLEYKIKSFTSGKAIVTRALHSYDTNMGPLPQSRNHGLLFASATGKVTFYALENLSVNDFFIKPGDEVYENQVVGENNKEGDMIINPVKEKKLTNVRSAGKDETTTLRPCKTFNIEEAIGFLSIIPASNIVLEITSTAIRLRKVGR